MLNRRFPRSALSAAAVLAVGLLTAMTARPDDGSDRGGYLARAGDCISCHTATGGTPFAGGYRIDTPFGALLAPNITPDPDTGIGRWNADEFYRALHDGVNRRGQDMYPAMPYVFYTGVTREDSDAIYAYLRTLPPVHNDVDVNQLRFPFNLRSTMAAWREIYFDEGSFKPDAARTAAWNRGAYLVDGLGHCSACHSPRSELGGIEKRKAYTGADIDGWFALNLTSSLYDGLGDWTAAEIATYLKTGAFREHTTSLGPMAEVVENSTSHLTDDDLAAMAQYLKSIPPDSPLRAARSAPAESRQRGASLYLDHCSACHQAKGRGMPGIFPPLAGNEVVTASEPNDVLQVVLEGIPSRDGYVAMPSFASQLSNQQVADLANYVRTSWGNGASPNATVAGVAALRKPQAR